jgi:uncharacterized protein with PQ loop repeat
MYTMEILGFKFYCISKSCLDEYVGFIAIIMGLLGFFIQLGKTTSTLNVSSWSIYALILVGASEALFFVQGVLKKSYSIAATRFCTFLGAVLYVYLWFDHHK